MNLGSLLSKKPAAPAPAKPAPKPATAPSASRLGVYKVKDDKRLTFTRYGIPCDFGPGFEVEVLNDRGDQLLVNFTPCLTLYVDAPLFLDSCTR